MYHYQLVRGDRWWLFTTGKPGGTTPRNIARSIPFRSVGTIEGAIFFFQIFLSPGEN